MTTKQDIHQLVNEAIDELQASTEAETTLEISCNDGVQGVIGAHARKAAESRGFQASVSSRPGMAIVRLVRRGVRWQGRGAPKSDIRQQIEGVPPAGFASFELEDEGDLGRIRGIVQSVQRATGRRFATEVVDGRTTLVIHRIDSLDQAPPHMAQDARATLQRLQGTRYGLEKLEVGQEREFLGVAVESLRGVATYLKRTTGLTFTVNKTSAGAIVTRIK